MRKLALALATTAILGMAAPAFAIEFWDCGANRNFCGPGKRQSEEDPRQCNGEGSSSSSWHDNGEASSSSSWRE